MVTLGQGLGLAMSLLSWVTSLYSLVPLAWALKLLFASTNSPLPWVDCRQIWNDNSTCALPDEDQPANIIRVNW